MVYKKQTTFGLFGRNSCPGETIIVTTIMIIIGISTWSNGLETEEEEVPDHVLVVVVQPAKVIMILLMIIMMIIIMMVIMMIMRMIMMRRKRMTHLSRQATTWVTSSSSSAYSSRETKALVAKFMILIMMKSIISMKIATQALRSIKSIACVGSYSKPPR